MKRIRVFEFTADGEVERDVDFNTSLVMRADFPGHVVRTMTVEHDGTVYVYIEKDES